MAGFGIKTPWTSQPQYPVAIDRSNPITRGLILAWTPSMSDRNSAGNKYNGTRVGTTITNTPSPYGIGVNSTGDGVADRIDLGSITSTDDLSGTVNGITVIGRVMVDTGTLTGVAPRLIDKSNGGTGANGWWFGIDSAVRPNFQVNSGTGFLGTALTQGVWSTMGVSAAQGGAPSFYINGRFDTVGGSSVTFPSVTTNAAIANWNHTTDRQWDGQINYVFVWNRELTAAEHAAVNTNPWQVFQPIERRIWVPSAGGSVNGTIAVTLENFTSAITGTTTVVGTIANTLDNFTSSISGTPTVVGTIAQTIVDFTSSISGSAGGVEGTIVATLEDFTSSITGTTTVMGIMNTVLDNFTSSISGTTTIVGTIAVILENFISGISGTVGTVVDEIVSRLTHLRRFIGRR